MRSSYAVEKAIGVQYREIAAYDKVEIDHPDVRAPSRLSYLDRVHKVVSMVRHFFPQSCGVTICELGCAQANISLLLAELGYTIYAMDINTSFLAYSRLKWERGDIAWIAGNLNDPPLREMSVHVAILGEILEHCAYPEDVVENAFALIRPGGILIITTPNGARIRTRLRTFGQLRSKAARKGLEERQYGPDGRHHLFHFKLEELQSIAPSSGRVISSGYLGGTVLVNRYTRFALKLVPAHTVERGIRRLSAIPWISRGTFNNLFVVLQKPGGEPYHPADMREMVTTT